jgi:hypothetical protein
VPLVAAGQRAGLGRSGVSLGTNRREGQTLPEISRFYGISIYLQFSDHAPPHVHAYYAEHEAKVAIADGTLFAGSLPPRAARLVREWIDAHRNELRAAWDRAMRHEPPGRIEPLP